MTFVSICCNAPEQMTIDGEPTYCRETGICPACKDYTSFEPEVTP